MWSGRSSAMDNVITKQKEDELTEFARHLKRTSMAVLERDICELVTDLEFLESQISCEPELSENPQTVSGSKQKSRLLFEKILLAQNEFRSRKSKLKTEKSQPSS